MVPKNWDVKTSDILYKRFQAGESLVSDLEALAKEKGIKEAIITSCIGSLSQLKLRNLCSYDEGTPGFERQVVDQILELVSAEGYIQPLPDGELRVHIHVAAALPSGQMIGGHCEDATFLTGAFMYLHVIEEI
jgi:predicted DNA-binding protein with PD1-like motif|tara:strand:- start:1018 stop:1416 length:399 start_codon:yes stop_codon:yes gene_type:complete